MPTSVISEPELRALSSWPDDVAHSDLVAYLCLGLEDIRWLRSHRNPVTRLAQGLRLAGLPYPGFVPKPVEAPHTVVRYVADQVGVSALALDEYLHVDEAALLRVVQVEDRIAAPTDMEWQHYPPRRLDDRRVVDVIGKRHGPVTGSRQRTGSSHNIPKITGHPHRSAGGPVL